jgi:hypothetical protein
MALIGHTLVVCLVFALGLTFLVLSHALGLAGSRFIALLNYKSERTSNLENLSTGKAVCQCQADNFLIPKIRKVPFVKSTYFSFTSIWAL